MHKPTPTLVPDEGADADFTVVENGAARTQTWYFPSRSECLACHTERGGFALSFNTRQLNRDHAFPGGTASILSALAQSGYLDPSTTPTGLPALVAPDNTTQTVEARARSYLDANCAQCHQPGGTALGSIDARASTPLSLAGLINGTLLDNGGDPANRVLVPGDAAHSRLLHRMSATNGATRMPPIATRERDVAGETLLAQWIAELAQPLPASRLINLATRAQTLTGTATLIPGFVVADGPKTLLIRAVGPTLSQFAVNGPLAQPVLTLLRGTQPIAANTRWGTAANATDIRATALRIGAFSLPDNSADSALLATLAPGDYTAQVTSANNATGIALVELYDADSTTSSTGRLINTAVRAQVGTGAQILIPGLVVGPGAMKTVLIRAIGPGLAAFNVTGFLAQPVLSLYAGGEAFRTNTAWSTAVNAADIRNAADRVGAFALAEGSADSALLVTLSPGAYTLQVSGANNTSGITLVEIYEVP
jgi:mono/diheme cytochrome c family protein